MLTAAMLSLVLAPQAGGGRIVVPLETGWLFRRERIPGYAFPTGWRRVTVPHDFAIEDLPPAEGVPKGLDVVSGTWRFRKGDDPSWKEPTLDDSDWKTVRLPSHWDAHGDAEQNAFGWYRRRVRIPAELASKGFLLPLGKIDDCDEAFLNGVRIGGSGGSPPSYDTAWSKIRAYPVPAGLAKGDGNDLLAVRVYNGGGQGGWYTAPGVTLRSGPFDRGADDGLSTGWTVPGPGTYRLRLRASPEWRGRRIVVRFDGSYMNTKVFLNGRLMGQRPYGYVPFEVDLTPALRFDAGNELRVEVDATPPNSRWYTGAGLYRPVRLEARHPSAIDDGSVFLRTFSLGQAAEASLEWQLLGPAPAGSSVRAALIGPDGRTAWSGAFPSEAGSVRLQVADPKPWSPEDPNLYTLRLELRQGRRLLDRVERKVGLRTLAWLPGQGLLLNGRPVKLLGGCVHHDNGPLGAVSLPDAEERKVRVLKSLGYNAIRTAHNPPSEALLDACDRLGLMVLDEIFDNWKRPKGSNYDRFFDDWWRKDVAAWLRRDRNHPSVVAYSIGNEIPEQAEPEGERIGALLAAEVRRWDPTRPVTMASFPVGGGWRSLEPLYRHLDIAGHNYMADVFGQILREHPNRLLIQTESQSPRMRPDLRLLWETPNYVGDFVWAAIDYLGEVGVGRVIRPGEPDSFFGTWPFVTTGSGEIDRTLHPKPQALLRKALFRAPNAVAVFAEPLPADYRVSAWGWTDEQASWTWPGRQGLPMLVRVYASTPRVRLRLNGADLGVRPTGLSEGCTAEWRLPYVPGRLVAEGLDARGRVAARAVLETAGRPVAIALEPESPTLRAAQGGLAFVRARVVDAKGRTCPQAESLLRFRVRGPAVLAAVDDGDPRSVESFQQGRRTAWQGRALAVLRSTGGTAAVTLEAWSDGLKAARVRLRAVPAR
ncbi:MAG: DUF4982 domain-containing protein [Fimbriimonadales bacterium]|nr:DUF4982 domain-containing protein [Fimbriimonadales bacterium]